MCAWAYGDSSVKGGRGVDLPEILHMIFFLLALPRLSPLFCPNLGGQLPPPRPPAPCLVRLYRCVRVGCVYVCVRAREAFSISFINAP